MSAELYLSQGTNTSLQILNCSKSTWGSEVLILVWGIFPSLIHLFKMHTFIQLTSVHLNTGVKSEVASLPELEHNSVHVKNTRQHIVNYTAKNYSFEFKRQYFQYYETSNCGNTPQNCLLLPWFSSQNESDWFFLFGWISCLGEMDRCYQVAISSSPQLQQLTGDSDCQVRRSRIRGLSFAFQRGKESSTAFCCLYSHWCCIPAKPRELQSITHPPCAAQRLCGLRRSIAFVSAPPLCPASTSSGERARLAL